MWKPLQEPSGHRRCIDGGLGLSWWPHLTSLCILLPRGQVILQLKQNICPFAVLNLTPRNLTFQSRFQEFKLFFIKLAPKTTWKLWFLRWALCSLVPRSTPGILHTPHPAFPTACPKASFLPHQDLKTKPWRQKGMTRPLHCERNSSGLYNFVFKMGEAVAQ